MHIQTALTLIGLAMLVGVLPSTTRAGTEDAPASKEYHVSVRGDDAHEGSASRPLRTISAAARLAHPGDVVTVHEGVYRERIDPPRGGTSDVMRIIYQADPGEKVVIKGSEVVKGWQKEQNDTWKLTLPDSFFGDFNPFKDVIRGDWFNPMGRGHHTGAVYLDGHWLTESDTLDDVLKPADKNLLWFTAHKGRTASYLFNVAWLAPGTGKDQAGRIGADKFAKQNGVQTADCSEGGKCIGWINAGNWVCYADVDFGQGTDSVAIRASAPGEGGRIEIHVDNPTGPHLGTATVTNTGDWQKWATFTAKIKLTAGNKTLCLVFRSSKQEQADTNITTIWAQFPGVDPNKDGIEINARHALFYPEKTGVNYITVRGFTMEHAATNWAPPTAEQVGLIGTHWSKGWVIENNTIRYSACTGLTLGKHGDEWDNTSQNTATGYVKTIDRAIENGWSGENIGHHIVRNNTISHCEQAGIVGSLGAVFSTITNNSIHDIHVRRLFTGAEMAGIKIHAAIDSEIRGNHIYRTCRGIWLDWMAQGTRVTGNLLHDNGPWEDLFVEVNHGPFLVDHNLLLSPIALFDMSEGGAYVHNLFAGKIGLRPELRRSTPFHTAHSTEVAGSRNIVGGDDRFYNNLFVGPDGLSDYDTAAMPVRMAGNVFFNSAQPSKHEQMPLVQSKFDPGIILAKKPFGMYLEIALDKAWAEGRSRKLVTTELLGQASISELPYEQHDGTPYRIDTDYFSRKRNRANPFPGPFELPGGGEHVLKIWPVATGL